VKLYLEKIPQILKLNLNQNNYVLDLFLNMHIFYIFKENWEKLEKLFENHNNLQFLKFIYYCCKIFEKIFNRNEDYINMKKDLIKFGTFLNDINYSNLLFAQVKQKKPIKLILDYLQELE